MNKYFVPKKESKELQQLGFDEDCLAFYNGNFLESTEYDFDSCNSKEVGLCTKAPTYSQAFRFFREKYDLHVQIRKENYFQQSAYEYFHFDISRGQDTDITKQEELLGEIFEESSQDIPGNHLNDEKFSKLIFERKFAFKTYEEIESYCLDKLIEIVK